MYERLDDAFSAIEKLYREATERAERAEGLCDYVLECSEARGLSFDCDTATRDWNARLPSESRPRAPWYQERMSARREEIRELRESLKRAHGSERLARTWARRERSRADAAVAECNSLMLEIERMRAVRAREDRY